MMMITIQFAFVMAHVTEIYCDFLCHYNKPYNSAHSLDGIAHFIRLYFIHTSAS